MTKRFSHQNKQYIFFIENILQGHDETQGYLYETIITP